MKYGTFVWPTKTLLTKPDKNSLCFSYFGRCKFLSKSLKTFAKCMKKEFMEKCFLWATTVCNIPVNVHFEATQKVLSLQPI